MKLLNYDNIVGDKKKMIKTVNNADHIIVLADRNIEWDDADVKTSILLLKLEDTKKDYDLKYNVVAELIKENSYNYVPKGPDYDYVITSSISSLVLAQIADKPLLRGVLTELLSTKGNNLRYLSPSVFGVLNEGYYITELKQIVLTYGFVMLGYYKDGSKCLNPTTNNKVTLKDNDKLIVLG